MRPIVPDHINQEKLKKRSQGIGQFFSSIPPGALFALIIIYCLVVTGAGAWLGHFRYLNGVREPGPPIDTAVSAILGLLAFMLGFTFSLTWSRYSSRNSLVIAQAKAIQDCYLRTNLIPEKQKSQIRKLLHEYTILLLSFRLTIDVEQKLAKIDEIHLLIWQQTTSLMQEAMDPETRTYFTSSVNTIISLAVERKTIALVFRIPNPIWTTLLILSAMGMFAFGYQTGISGVRRIFGMSLLPIAFGLVIVLIADLNSSGIQRRFKVTQRPLQDVLNMMAREIT